MKKTLLSAAAFAVVAVSAVSIAPTTSEAIPAFARQTGAACLSCHFQSFPTLSSFGRSFKEGAFTDVGEQALIEDDNLSIPSTLNMTLMFRPQFNSVKDGTATPGTAAAAVNKTIAATADQVLMFGGRIGSNTGAFVEYDGTFANQQLLHSIDVGNGKVVLSYFNAGFGEDSGLQLMSVWGQHGGLLNGKSLSINNAMGAAGNTVGVSVAYANEMGAISLGGINNSTAGANWTLAPTLRAQGFFDMGGAELGVGAIVVNGNVGPTIAGVNNVAKRIGVDVQVQGEMGDTQYGIYADYASASASSLSETNFYNTTSAKRDGYSLRATVKPTHNLVLLAGFGQDKTAGFKVTKFLTGVEFELYQNAVINLTYSADKFTNNGLTAAGNAAAIANVAATGNAGNQSGTVKTIGLDFEFLM